MAGTAGSRRRIKLVVAVTAALVSVGACSAPQSAGKVPTASAFSSTPPMPSTAKSVTSPRPTLSAAPSSATAMPSTPKQEVEAAVRGYYAELTRAAQTNETTRLKKLVDRGCPCYGSAESIDETSAGGRSIPDAKWTLKSLRIHDLEKNSAGVEVGYLVAAYSLLDPSGHVLERFPRRSVHVDLVFVRRDSNWILSNVYDLEA